MIIAQWTERLETNAWSSVCVGVSHPFPWHCFCFHLYNAVLSTRIQLFRGPITLSIWRVHRYPVYPDAVSLRAIRCVSGRKIDDPRNLSLCKSNGNRLGFFKYCKIIFFLREVRFGAQTSVFITPSIKKKHKLPSSSFHNILVWGFCFVSHI